MSVINYPDRKGTLSQFCPKCMRYPQFRFSATHIGGGVAGPPNQPNYALGAAVGPDCNSVGLQPELELAINELLLYPNRVMGW